MAQFSGEQVLAELESLIPDLPAAVLSLLKQIPAGQVTTYGDLARALGDDQARSARWLGEFLKNHAHDDHCPCHRVVRSNGDVGLSLCGDPHRKAGQLRREGVNVSLSGRVELSHRKVAFESGRPLAHLKSFQRNLAARVTLLPLTQRPLTVAGLDVAYPDPQTACAAYVLLNAQTLQTEWEFTLLQPVRFPYIPGYLTFRELPILLELCRQVAALGKLADLLMIDGNGQLHPWRAGIATCLGVALNQPAIGISKSLLCGRVLSPSTPDAVPLIQFKDEIIGAAIHPSGTRSPFYVSAGHRITLPEAVDLAGEWTRQRKLPEPVFLADRLSKQAKRQQASPKRRVKDS